MMMPVTSISATLTAGLPRVGSPSIIEQAQFERALGHAADSLKNNAAAEPASAAPVAAAMDVQRAAAPTSGMGDRVLQTISSLYPHNTVSFPALDHDIALSKGALPGPAQKLPVAGEAGTGISGIPQQGQDFETMMAGLRDVYNGVTQVALISKGVSGVTSSVNKLLKEG
ncbi:nodulation protein NolB [Mesorhizobium sp.]|uniref:nodulation protein NolB n=1 Tax=Mesorhizobium sp. TaxID=1871066 RepID=UPI000FE9C802|nr:nodulation protein NolB [Mesorhizobium sp.]RWM38953.1 MAG: nodulation protein NolB [Mesorhizobium sp.]